jgi:phosphatidylinositol alpha-mannosyltransferase
MFRGGGVQEIVFAMQKELIERGHYVKIISPRPMDYDGEIPDSIITLGGSVNTTAFAGTAWQWSVSVDTDAIDAMFEREKFDVVHFHEPWIPVWSRQLVLRSPAANVGTMHARFVDTITAKTVTTTFIPYTKPMIKYFDAFTAASEAATEYFKSLSRRPITIVPNGIDLDKFQDRPTATAHHLKKKTIFYVGRLENRKGLKYLLRAFHELSKRRKDVQLLIAGNGPDKQKLHDFVEDENIPRVKFLGFISDKEKIDLLHSSDVFCSPALYGESFGIVLLEAMATGCPVVAGDNIGYQMTMKGTGAISLVNPRDIIDFSRRLELMVFDDGLRKLWHQWADPYVEQFDYPKVVDQYLEVYKQAIEHHEERKS